MGKIFEVRKSRIDHNGLFATVPIRQGELICRMEGEEISIPELKRRYASGCERLTDPLQVREDRYIDLDEPFVYLNH